MWRSKIIGRKLHPPSSQYFHVLQFRKIVCDLFWIMMSHHLTMSWETIKSFTISKWNVSVVSSEKSSCLVLLTFWVFLFFLFLMYQALSKMGNILHNRRFLVRILSITIYLDTVNCKKKYFNSIAVFPISRCRASCDWL